MTQQNGILYIVDVDETLFSTTALISVIKDGQVVKRLTNQEYNTYILQDGERFNFGEFMDSLKFYKESTPIKRMIETIIRIHNKIKLNLYPHSKMMIVTARDGFDDEVVFKQTFKDQGIDIDSIEVLCAGGMVKEKVPTPVKKKMVIKPYLEAGYKAVYMIDDSKPNLSKFLELAEDYPGTNFKAFLASHAGDMAEFIG